jgi:hypothetical protein
MEVDAKKGTKEMEDKEKEKKRGKVDAAVLHRATRIPGTFYVPLSPWSFLSCLATNIVV